MGIVDRFRSRLEELELERLKVARDRQTYRFLAFLLTFLSFCSLTAGLWGSSQLVVILGLCLGACAAALWYLRKNLDGAYQIKFREAITREWFQERFRSAYLTPPPEVVSEELRVAIREAAVRATHQSPKNTVVEERILFDRDSHTGMILVLREGSALRPKSRALVWCKIRSGDDGVVAFVWPPMMPTQNKLDIRFFKDGRRISPLEPLAGKLETLVEMVKQQGSALITKNAIRVGYAPRGVFVGCRLSRRLFEAPVSESLFNEESFAHWETDAVLPLSFEIRSNVNSVF